MQLKRTGGDAARGAAASLTLHRFWTRVHVQLHATNCCLYSCERESSLSCSLESEQFQQLSKNSLTCTCLIPKLKLKVRFKRNKQYDEVRSDRRSRALPARRGPLLSCCRGTAAGGERRAAVGQLRGPAVAGGAVHGAGHHRPDPCHRDERTQTREGGPPHTLPRHASWIYTCTHSG